jgi:DNA-binding transcriptional LysR family regulator
MDYSVFLRKFSLHQLRYFCTVARKKSFAAAAQELHISASALTMGIRAFEQELGVQLLVRTTRSVSLTALGEEFLPQAERSLEQLGFALHGLQQTARLLRGRVTVAASPALAHAVLSPAIQALHAMAPEILFDVQTDSSEGVFRRVSQRLVDFGLTGRWIKDDGLAFDPLVETRYCAVLPSHHPWAQKKSLNWDEFLRQPQVSLGHDTAIHRFLEQQGLQLPPNAQGHTGSDPEMAKMLVANGLGLAALPAFAASTPHHPALKLLPLRMPTVKLISGLVFVQEIALSPAAAQLVRLMREQTRKIAASNPQVRFLRK